MEATMCTVKEKLDRQENAFNNSYMGNLDCKITTSMLLSFSNSFLIHAD